MTDYDLYSLGPREFEHLIQSLSIKIIATGVTPFGDGPDGGREATYEGKMKYPSENEPWDGYLVIQCKHRTKGASYRSSADGNWALNQLERELKKYIVSNRNMRFPDYYIFATNISLSAAYLTGAKDRLNNLLRKYAELINIKSYDIWSYDEVCRFLDSNMDIRSHYAHFLSSGDLLIEVRNELDNIKETQQDVTQILKHLEVERRDLQNRLDKLTFSSMRFATDLCAMINFSPEKDQRITELSNNVNSFIQEINKIIDDDHPDMVLSRATISFVKMDYNSVLELIPLELSDNFFKSATTSAQHAIEAYRLRAAAFFRLRLWKEAISEYKLLLQLDQNANFAKRNIGVSLLELGLIEDAKKKFYDEKKRLENIYVDNPNLEDTLNLISNYGYCALLNRHVGYVHAAIVDSQKALSLLIKLNNNIPSEEFNSHFGHIHNNLGLVYKENGQASKALALLKKSILFFKKILKENLNRNSDDHHTLAYAVSMSNCADSYLSLGDKKNALQYYNLAELECTKLFGQKSLGGAIDELASILTNRSAVYSEKDKKKSLKDLNRAVGIRKKLIKEGYLDRRKYLAITMLNRGRELCLYGKNEYALKDLNHAISTLERTKIKKGKIKFILFYIIALVERSKVYFAMEKKDSSLKDLDTAIQIFLRNKDAQMPNMIRLAAANAFYMRGNTREILKFNNKEILSDFNNSIRILQDIVDNNCDEYQAYSLLCYALIRRAGNKIGRSQNIMAEADYNHSITIAEKYIKNNGSVPKITLSLIWGLYSRYDVYSKIGEMVKAKSDLFRSAVLVIKYHEVIDLKREERLIGNVLAEYSSALIDGGRSQDVIQECKFFIDYLKNKNDKIKELSQAKIYNNVGYALTLNGKPQDAIGMFDNAIVVYSNYDDKEESESLLAGSLNNRGNAEYTSGKFDNALIDYDSAIEIAERVYSKDQSDENKFLFARSLVSKAWFLSTCEYASYREPCGALALAENACEIMKWCDVDCLYTYAAACAENNEFIKACSWQRKAISMSSSKQERAFLEMILFNYENKKPYRARTV